MLIQITLYLLVVAVYGKTLNHRAVVTMLAAVPINTDDAATRFAVPYIFAKT